jgi:hypothetical protein
MQLLLILPTALPSIYCRERDLSKISKEEVVIPACKMDRIWFVAS